jgi:hypothetical protein
VCSLYDQVRFIGKIGIPTQNVLAICDFDMRFTYVAAGQPGVLHDTSILYHAMEVDAQVSHILHKVQTSVLYLKF